MRGGRFERVCAVALLSSACHTTVRDDSDSLSGGGTDDASSGADVQPTSAPEDDGSPGGADEAGDDVKLDVAAADDGLGPDDGCRKIDFLFVIDNSGSMWDNQINLANSFPGFIETITETLDAQDYHIMVTDSDAWTPMSTLSNIDGACEVYPWCCFEVCGPSSTCASFLTGDTSYGPCPVAPPAPTACDATLGAGRNLDFDVFDPHECAIADGRRYMLQTQPDLLGTFECVARAGIGGDWNERPVGAAVAALSEPLNGAGGCNEGFLRDDALLVLTIISDANPYSGHLDLDVPSAEFHDAIVAAKHGDPQALVVLGLFDDGHVAASPCPNPNGNEYYQEVMSHFGARGFYGSVCAEDYTPFFLDAVDDIDAACEDFEPPG
jgi:hypothetical protein